MVERALGLLGLVLEQVKAQAPELESATRAATRLEAADRLDTGPIVGRVAV